MGSLLFVGTQLNTPTQDTPMTAIRKPSVGGRCTSVFTGLSKRISTTTALGHHTQKTT
ncbi:MAG: hypothetical protein QW688_09585 [Thermoprotei archaeon]